MEKAVRIRSSGGLSVKAAAVVFDLDGVLVVSDQWWVVAEELAITRLGGTWNARLPRNEIAGTTPTTATAALSIQYGLEGKESVLEQEIERAAAEIFRENVCGVPGAHRVLREISSYVPVGIATNSPRNVAEASLASVGFMPWVDALVTVDDVAEGKPHPEVYLRACEVLKVAPSRALAIDDSMVGVSSAVAAGLKVLGFGNQDTLTRASTIGHIVDWSGVQVLHGATTS